MPRTPGSTYSAAALVLARCGVTQHRVATRLGIAANTVSTQLNGQHRPHPKLVPAIRALAGVDAAKEIAQILGLEVSS